MKTLSRRFALRALVAGALLFLALGPTAEAGAEGGTGTTVVYYFHATARCATCRTIEAYAHEALHLHRRLRALSHSASPGRHAKGVT
jgi:hypothetical protein